MNLIIKGTFVFFGVLIFTFALLYSLINPLVQDAYSKGYEKGKNDTCRVFIEYKEEKGDNPYNRPIKLIINASLNLSSLEI